MKKLIEIVFGSLIKYTRRDTSMRDGYAPYGEPNSDRAYNMLFGDKPALYRAEHADAQGEWATLLAEEPYAAALREVAEDRARGTEQRLLAYQRLREIEGPIARQELLGVVVELRMPEGLDVLAVYADATVRRIRANGQVAAHRAPNEWKAHIRTLHEAAQRAVDRIGPWLQPRAKPPTEGMVRMSFLVSDGLYFGQGLIEVMRQDALAAPIISAAQALTELVDAHAAIEAN